MIPGEPEAIARPADQAREPAELKPFQPPLKLALDQDKKQRYQKLKYHVEAPPSVLVGVANDGTILSNGQVIFSDLLGDHRMFLDFTSVSTFSNFFYEYLNLKRRWNWDIFAEDFRDYYIAQSLVSGAVFRTRQFSSFTGVGAVWTRSSDIPTGVGGTVGGVK